MITSVRASAPNVSRFTGFVLAMTVFVCVSMIGIAGYMKYRLDRAESLLAASPEAALNTAQEPYDRLRRSLGYGGFVSIAQNFIASHDASLLQDMKAHIKGADEIVARLSDRVSLENRRDLTSITSIFDSAMQKIEKDPNSFTSSDLLPLYAALPVLDDRVAAASSVSRLEAQNNLQFWSMLLTLVCWASLIIAAATAVGIYLSLRDRNSAPLRALAQSVKNMAHGDMSTAIWGMERSDMVGELARTIDIARYNFSQMPDMTLISDQGPVRIRFEGNTKSLFEAMMQLITRDSEQIRTQAGSLATAVKAQQDAITKLAFEVEMVLGNILKRGQDGNQQVKQVLQDTLVSAQSLKSAQEHAADQLNRIVPYLQERAQGISEITHITGKQVAQVLQSLILTERGLKSSAEQSEDALKKISANADSLGDRLFGAINLLQASGKVLAETTETTQSRLKEAIERINVTVPGSYVAPSDASGTDVTPRLVALVSLLEDAHKKLESVLSERSQTTTQITGKLENIEAKLDQRPADGSVHTPVTVDNSAMENRLADISSQIGAMARQLALLGTTTPTEPSNSGDLLLEIKSGFETTTRSLAQMREQLTNMVINVQSQMPVPVIPESSEHWKDITAQIDATRNSLTELVTLQIERVESRLATLGEKSGPVAPALPADAQEQMEQQTQILTELVATLGVLDAHMQQLKTDVRSARG